MPIDSIENSVLNPVIGKIRLGVTVPTAKGNERPEEVPYFVLEDAPDVKAVYGERPTELDVMFISDDRHEVAPYFYKLYSGGSKDKNGKLLGGSLKCQGDGKTARHIAMRDPITGVIPERACLTKSCPDWKDAKGRQACGAAMTVYVMLPRVSLFGVYQISTRSQVTMRNFVAQLKYLQDQFGVLKGIPFKIKREETMIPHHDESGKEVKSRHFPMKIIPNREEFTRLHGTELQQKVLEIAISLKLPTPAERERTDEGYPYEIGAGTVDVPKALPKGNIQEVAEDEEVLELFEELCKLTGKPNTPKVRLMTARKFENSSDPGKELVEYLVALIQGARSKVTAEVVAAAPVMPPPAPVTPPPAPTGDAPSVSVEEAII